jgi:hypothetical protein
MTSKPKFIINDYNILSSWGYKLSSNTDCTICRCNLNSSSIYNQEKGLDSQIVSGVCSHTFHSECIKPWIEKNNHCPICSTKWIYLEKNT